MANFDQRPNRNCLLIADTVLVKSNDQDIAQPTFEVLTKVIPKLYADISYSIDENDEEVPEEDKHAERRQRAKEEKEQN